MTEPTPKNANNGFNNEFEQQIKQLEKIINSIAAFAETGNENATDLSTLEKINWILATTKEAQEDLNNLIDRFNKFKNPKK